MKPLIWFVVVSPVLSQNKKQMWYTALFILRPSSSSSGGRPWFTYSAFQASWSWSSLSISTPYYSQRLSFLVRGHLLPLSRFYKHQVKGLAQETKTCKLAVAGLKPLTLQSATQRLTHLGNHCPMLPISRVFICLYMSKWNAGNGDTWDTLWGLFSPLLCLSSNTKPMSWDH